MSEGKSRRNVNEEIIEYDAAGSYGSYLEYNKILRTWFVAFGIGGPALFLANPALATRLVAVEEMRYVATLFLIGAAAQIIGAFVNKVANYYVYRSGEDKTKPKRRTYVLAEWLVEQFWIDLFLDLVTMISFGIAAWQLLTVFGHD